MEFECKTGSIELCQCQSVSLDESQSSYISELFEECLCAACLKALRSEHNVPTFGRRLCDVLSDRQSNPDINSASENDKYE